MGVYFVTEFNEVLSHVGDEICEVIVTVFSGSGGFSEFYLKLYCIVLGVLGFQMGN